MSEREWRVELPSYDRPPLSLNQRLSWRAAYSQKITLGYATHWGAYAAHVPLHLARIHVELHWRPAINRKRDTDNPTPTLKAAIDALVRYGVVVDDDSEHVTSAVVIHPAAKPAAMWLVVREVA